MKLVYIAGPFSAPTREGVERNIAAAVAVGIEVAKLGAFPVVPHANTAHPEYEKLQPYQFWIDGTMELLRRCDALVTVDGWQKSIGARGEVHEMQNVLKRAVFASVDSLRAWLDEPRYVPFEDPTTGEILYRLGSGRWEPNEVKP